MVTTLSVDPGSYTSLTARLRTVSAEISVRSLGSNPGALATASSSPVPTWSTMTVPRDRPVVSSASGQVPLGGELDLAVDGEHHVGPGYRRLHDVRHPAGSGSPYRSRSIMLGAVGAGELVVEGELEPFDAPPPCRT